MSRDQGRLPRVVGWMVFLLAPRALRAVVVGDMEEEFGSHWRRHGRRAARCWAWRQLASSDWIRLRRAAAGIVRTHVWNPRASPLPEPNIMENLLFDLRSAIRTIRYQPRLACTVVVTIAVAIVGAASILAVVDAVLLAPLPYEDAERLVALRTFNEDNGISDGPVSWVNLGEWRQINAFDGVFAIQGTSVTITGGDHPENLNAARVSPGTLAILGVEPLLGRAFLAEEEIAGNDRVAVLSHGLWQSRFGGDAQAVGQSLVLDDIEYVVVGVLPEGFRMPIELAIGFTRDLLIPLAPEPADMPRIRRAVFGYARLAEGVSLRASQQAMNGAFAGQITLDPRANSDWEVRVRRVVDVIVGPFRTVLLVMMGAAGMLLLLAAVNLANLMTVHGLRRQGEMAVRAALGADRARLIRTLLTEGVVLGLIGGVVGIGGASGLLGLLTRMTPGDVPRLEDAAVNPVVVLTALGVAAAAGVLLGGVPALLATRTRSLGRLTSAGHASTPERRQRRALDLAVAIQVALAVVLLVGAGLLGRSFVGLLGVDPGFETDNVLTVQLVLVPPNYQDLGARNRFVEEAVREFEAIPGVSRAGVTNFLPYSGANTVDGFALRDMERTRRQAAGYRAVDAGYLEVLRLPVVAGRPITSKDIDDGAPVALISESMAAAYFADSDPIGQGISRGDEDEPGHQWLEIVGVVADVRHSGPDSVAEPEWYSTYDRDPYSLKSFTLRTTVPPNSLAADARQVLAKLDPALAPFAVQSLAGHLDDHVAGPRFNVATMASFALAAVLIAAVGMFGVIANSVARRAHEMGIRLALGARAAQLRNQVVGQGLRLAAGGVVAGLLASVVLSRVLTSMLRGIGPRDPMTLSAVAFGTLAVALLACYLPARRATRVDPVQSLRADGS